MMPNLALGRTCFSRQRCPGDSSIRSSCATISMQPATEALNWKPPLFYCLLSEVPSIVIRPYSPSWKADFSSLKEDLFRAMGPQARRIAHIGSTSVPGLGAKDIIDIQVGVDALNDDLVSSLVEAGYEFVARHASDHVPQGDVSAPEGWKKLFFRGAPQKRACHVHVRVIGSPNHRYALVFRDYLRVHEQARLTVELIKRELARLHGNDADAYYAVKDPVYDLVWQAANDWSVRSGWSEERASDD